MFKHNAHHQKGRRFSVLLIIKVNESAIDFHHDDVDTGIGTTATLIHARAQPSNNVDVVFERDITHRNERKTPHYSQVMLHRLIALST